MHYCAMKKMPQVKYLRHLDAKLWLSTESNPGNASLIASWTFVLVCQEKIPQGN